MYLNNLLRMVSVSLEGFFASFCGHLGSGQR